MDIRDVLNKLSEEDQLVISDYIEATIDEELSDKLYWIEREYETDVEIAVEEALRDYEPEEPNPKGAVDPWLQHNERGHAGSLSMCSEEPCIYA